MLHPRQRATNIDGSEMFGLFNFLFRSADRLMAAISN